MDNVHQRIRLSLFPSVSLFTVVKSVFTSLKGKYYLNNAPEKRTSYILPDVYLDWKLLSRSQRLSALTRNCSTLLFLWCITNGYYFETSS